MKADLLKRVERIEESRVNIGEGVAGIFVRYVTPGHLDSPVSGWRCDYGAERLEVLRGEGESDSDLKERAITLAREHIGKGNIPSFTSVSYRQTQ
jgi:hypothetical protein